METETEKHMSEKTIKSSLSVPLAIVVAGALIAGAIFFSSRGGPSQTPTKDRGGKAADAEAQKAQRLLSVGEGDYVLGRSEAPVTIVEFGDFECPFCAKFHNETRDQIIKNYVETGKAKIVWRHFPLSAIHQNAESSSLATECAGEQGKFWEYHDMLFEGDRNLEQSALFGIAQSLGLNQKQFSDCFHSGKYSNKISEEFRLGSILGVSGTPTFFINGTKLVGALPYSSIEPVIESAFKNGNQ